MRAATPTTKAAASKFKAELIPGDGFDGNDFAFTVGISGNTIAVGAPVAGNNGAGAAYVFGK